MFSRAFMEEWVIAQTAIHQLAIDKGFWKQDEELDLPPRVGAAMRLALIHSEVSEALEGLRHGTEEETLGVKSDKVPAFLAMEEELADTIIRILDLAGRYDLKIIEAIVAKLEYNLGRPYMHGKQL